MRQILSPAASRTVGLIVLGVLGVLPLGRMLMGDDLLYYAYQFGAPIAVVVFLAISAALLGNLLLPASVGAIERLALSEALGLGIFSFAFALSHLMNAPFLVYLVALVLPGWIAGFIRLRNADTGRLESLPRFAFSEAMALLVLILAGAMAFVASLTPPVSYDVLEYHLPLIDAWIQTNALGDIPYNFYTQLPAATEAIFATAAWMARTLAAAKIVNFLLLCATALTVAALAIRMGASRLFALLAAAHFCLHPTSLRIYVDAFADMGAALFVASSALALLVWANDPRVKWAAVAGVLAGFAVGAKSSTAGVFVAPVVILAFLLPIFFVRPYRDGELHLRIPQLQSVVFLLAAALAFLPWMLRGYRLTGNPASPFLNALFGADPWRVETERLWLAMHGWASPCSAEHLHAIVSKLRIVHWPWIGGVVAALFICRSAARGLGLIAILGYVVYCLLGEAPDRFAAPLIALAIALTAAAASIASDTMPRTRPFIVVLLFLLAWSPFWGAVENMVGAKNLEYALTANEEEYQKRWMPFDLFKAASDLPAEAKILVLYEARTALIQRAHTANTVFDKSPIIEIVRSGKDDSLGEKIKAAGYTHVLVNEEELARLIDMQASPTTREDRLYKQLRSISQTGLRYHNYLQHPEWYLPYERMKATPAELAEIRKFTDEASARAIYRKDNGAMRLFLASVE